MFVGGAYREGFDQGSEDGHAGRDKRPRPSFWKGLVSRSSYAREFVHGYHAGYAHGYRGHEIAKERRAVQASSEERLVELARGRTRERETERER
ncbi:hypothetical protein [Rhodospirillum sp. A1_3_36]|uniref:hypothetical protein n=1 Tax=Rhodospirillum sp. A1_3_36 TaxID=3391666 RepID=UPI0039A4E6AF